MAVAAATFRPLGKWLLVKADPRVKKSKGGIHMPDGQVLAERKMEGTGTILKMGGRVSEACGGVLEPGMRICYKGYLKDASAMEFETIKDCPVFMIRIEDVLAIVEGDTQMGFLS